jgi:hypothetical protein
MEGQENLTTGKHMEKHKEFHLEPHERSPDKVTMTYLWFNLWFIQFLYFWQIFLFFIFEILLFEGFTFEG